MMFWTWIKSQDMRQVQSNDQGGLIYRSARLAYLTQGQNTEIERQRNKFVINGRIEESMLGDERKFILRTKRQRAYWRVSTDGDKLCR